MKKLLYLPLAAVVGAAGLTVWAQANAGPTAPNSPGIVVADVSPGVNATGTGPALNPSPAATITATPWHTETQRVQVEMHTYTPVQITSKPLDDKGGSRPEGVSDDSAAQNAGDDKGGLRPEEVSDDDPSHNTGDDKGGLRAETASDDGSAYDLDDDKDGEH